MYTCTRLYTGWRISSCPGLCRHIHTSFHTLKYAYTHFHTGSACMAVASLWVWDLHTNFRPHKHTPSQWQRALGGGFLVGVGSALGNGCTSGHSICGMARFSTRSIIYTLIYMGAGAAAALATGGLAAGDCVGKYALLERSLTWLSAPLICQKGSV